MAASESDSGAASDGDEPASAMQAAPGTSGGHCNAPEEQVSARSHAPPATRQTTPPARIGARGVQSPFCVPPAARLQAWQSSIPSPQAVEQQTPSTQKPLSQSVGSAHASPASR